MDSVGIEAVAVQKETAAKVAELRRKTAPTWEVLDIETAAALVRITPKRLRGLILRDDLHDPIGDLYRVYDDWRLRRLADHSPAGRP